MQSNKNRKNINNPIFIRYLFSFLLCFSAVFFLFFLFFKLYFYRVYKEEVEINNLDQTIQTGHVIDSNIEQIDNIFYQIKIYDKEFNAAKAEDTIHQIDMSERLFVLVSTNDLVFNVVYYQKNLTSAIAAQKVMSLKTMDQYYFSYDNWEKDDMLNAIMTLDEIYWRPFETITLGIGDKKEVMTVCYPITRPEHYNASFLQIQIEKTAFEKLLSLDSDILNTFIIMDDEGAVFYESEGIAEQIKSELYDYLVNSNSNNNTTFETNGLLVSKVDSMVNDWNYFSIIPSDVALLKVKKLQTISTVFMILILFFGFLLSYIVTRRNYKPIKELKKVIKGITLPFERHTDAIDEAKTAISYLSELSSKLRDNFELSSDHIKYGLLYDLLQGKFRTIEEFNNNGLGIYYSKPSFFLIVVSGWNRSDTLETSVLEAEIGEYYENYEINIFHSSYQAFICAADNEKKAFQIEEDFIRINEKIKEKYSTPLKIGISTSTTDLSILEQKYMEAVFALGYINPQKEPVSLYGNNKFHYTIYYPTEEIKILRQFIDEGNKDKYLKIIDTLVVYIESMDASLFIRICICYDIINALLRILIEMDDEFVPNKALESIELIPFKTNGNIHLYIEVIKRLSGNIVSLLDKKHKNANKYMEQLKEYIGTHYLEEDFSAQKVADEYSVTLSWLSAYFKKNMNLNLSVYITDLKMKYAMKILRDSDISLSEIARETGYSNTSSFIRRFKQYTGVTPGEYKETCKTE